MKENLKKEVIAAVSAAFDDVDTSGVSVDLSDNFGDYACNAAMVLAKQVEKNPREVAEALLAELQKKTIEHVEKIEIAGPGFINFYLSNAFFVQEVQGILTEGHGCGKSKLLDGKNILIEYTDPNPFKVFHIGHLMPNVIGEALSRVYEFGGATVKRANYQGDIGLHVAKAMWGIYKMRDAFPSDEDSLEVKTKFLGEAYVVGATAYDVDKDEKAIEEIKDINKKVYESSGDEEFKEIYDKGRQWSLDHFETLYRILGTRFDFYFFESQTFSEGTQTVMAHVEDGVFEKSDGAIIFAGSKFGLHDRVFINSEGLPTYEAKDLGLVMLKNKTCGDSDLSIVVTGSEQTEYFKVLMKAAEQIVPELAGRMKHIGHGMLRMTTGKMSSRKGNVITGESLLREIIALANEKISLEDVSETEKKNIAQAVGVAAIKFSILRNNIFKDVVYDTEKALSFEGDSGPYVQYTNARTQSLLRKAHERGLNASVGEYAGEITQVEKLLHRFSRVVDRAIQEEAPHHIATYLLELSGAFNAYYANNSILDSEHAHYRLALTQAVSQVLRNGLYILGITAPERM
jgi:arginyl-tRNA synthetase